MENAETENAETGTETRKEMGNDRQATFHSEKKRLHNLCVFPDWILCVGIITFHSAKQKRLHLRCIFLEWILAATVTVLCTRNEKY